LVVHEELLFLGRVGVDVSGAKRKVLCKNWSKEILDTVECAVVGGNELAPG